MKNEVLCRNCNTANAAYQLNCSNCNSYLRERVVNIDLWHTISLLTVTPSDGFKRIRNSEHKNFIIFILIFVLLKLTQNTAFLSLFHHPEPVIFAKFMLNFGVISGIFLGILFLFSLLLKVFAGISKVKLRFWDNFSIMTYAFFPYVAAFIILLPLEYVMFAEYLFSLNPSWFGINTPLAYLLTALEGLCFLWSAFLLYCGIKTQTNSKLFSTVFSFVFIFITYLTYFVLSKYLFM